MQKALADANVPYIEVSHGDGLAGSSLQYGLSLVDEMELIEAAVDAVAGESKIAVLLLPGIGTLTELKQAARLRCKNGSCCYTRNRSRRCSTTYCLCKRIRNGNSWIPNDVTYGSC